MFEALSTFSFKRKQKDDNLKNHGDLQNHVDRQNADHFISVSRQPPTTSPNDRVNWFGSTNRFAIADQIIEISESLRSLSDAEMHLRSKRLQALATSHAELKPLLPDAYALVRESARRAQNQSHFEVQLAAGIGLFEGGIVEMQTGEGKTLSALLPAYLYALVGKGCHVVTSNDYLATRDAEFASSVFSRLGISVGCVDEKLKREERQQEYDQDITYGTAREFGFDFLKDRLAANQASQKNGDLPAAFQKMQPNSNVQRGHYFALVDEADSVMIDDARTPLLIAEAVENSEAKTAMTVWCSQFADKLIARTHFELNSKHRNAKLTNFGSKVTLNQCNPQWIHLFGVDEIYRQMENSIVANHFFHRDRHYIINDQEVAIVDESTGRVADGRKWQNGLHQAIEAKENLPVTEFTETMARVTVQTLFRRYQHLAGLTGTAVSVKKEFKKVYDLQVTSIPTRLPCQRHGLPTRIFKNYDAKSKSIAMETAERTANRQSVLIGTPSVAASQKISHALTQFGINHEVLNCTHHEMESNIVSRAGQAGSVTVATNMAGRGTDILVEPSVLSAGGLHIIATEMHSSSRIDRQLIGRTARQGQPGSFQFFVSLEDELFALTGTNAGRESQCKPLNEARPLHDASVIQQNTDSLELGANEIRIFKRAQAKLEKLHEKQRLNLLEKEKKRNEICSQIGIDPCLELLEE